MFFKKIDMLSPYITLYFKGGKRHSSKFSGILSIIAYIFVVIAGIYYILDFISKQNPKAYFYNRYVDNAGDFPLNSSSMFNFIQIYDISTNEAIPFDYSKIRVIGTDEVLSNEYMNDPNIIVNKNHWLYGYCNNNTDTKGIGYLIDFKNYEKSSCIRKYYDKETKKYYNTGENGFRWPVLSKGCSNPKRTYYGIIMQRCDQVPDFIKSQGIECSSENEITELINKISLNFEIIDHYPDILNYRNPLKKYFYSVTSAFSNGVYIINHLNFNPANMMTHNGIFFDNIVQEHSYIFVQNEKHTIDSSNLGEGETTNGCLIGIYFWMQNTLQYYERIYTRLQDNLSDIGGIYSIVESVAYILNFLVHNYIIVLDTEDLVINRDINNFTRINREKRPTIFKNATKINQPPRRKYPIKYRNHSQEEQFSSNNQELFKNNRSNAKKNYIIRNINNNVDIYNNNKVNNNFIYEKSKDTNFTRNNYKEYKGNESKAKIKEKYNQLNTDRNKDGNHEKNSWTIEDDIDDIENSQIEKLKINWFIYFWNSLKCGKKDNKIDYYENFRAKLISEESIIQNYLDVYKLLALNNLSHKGNIEQKNESNNNKIKFRAYS